MIHNELLKLIKMSHSRKLLVLLKLWRLTVKTYCKKQDFKSTIINWQELLKKFYGQTKNAVGPYPFTGYWCKKQYFRQTTESHVD